MACTNILMATKLNFRNILSKKNYSKMFPFITFHVKVQRVQNHRILGLLK